jgi:hypothetical protein
MILKFVIFFIVIQGLLLTVSVKQAVLVLEDKLIFLKIIVFFYEDAFILGIGALGKFEFHDLLMMVRFFLIKRWHSMFYRI